MNLNDLLERLFETLSHPNFQKYFAFLICFSWHSFFKSHLFQVGRNKVIYGIPIFLPEVQTEIQS